VHPSLSFWLDKIDLIAIASSYCLNLIEEQDTAERTCKANPSKKANKQTNIPTNDSGHEQQ